MKKDKANGDMSKLRELARGQECQVRMPGICNGDPETVVLAHLNGAGMGMKHHDILGAFSCSACHDEVDRRTRITPLEYARLHHLEGVIRTQLIMLDKGLI